MESFMISEKKIIAAILHHGKTNIFNKEKSRSKREKRNSLFIKVLRSQIRFKISALQILYTEFRGPCLAPNISPGP